ncbi:hypothetical protein DSM3645_28512 [Blastopirellula marina DSM 3645]|uniref:Uncharacterized protein n=1 Tax=Blastopirellula marina DSM 3645 TaxID=314230 RepID=A3ZPC4_9BACT|nr:hypothetical protein DSM3645_28512 [Blastopirellula marina DSM 3645]
MGRNGREIETRRIDLRMTNTFDLGREAAEVNEQSPKEGWQKRGWRQGQESILRLCLIFIVIKTSFRKRGNQK